MQWKAKYFHKLKCKWQGIEKDIILEIAELETRLRDQCLISYVIFNVKIDEYFIFFNVLNI